ncbi:hypothetical protein B0T19DRAFT_451958 [Cercophora scortea]|uniref:Uncharacterized protein n=1 Tax=Cercophora scortea TaxID=314031 RepID=A0AAE0J1D8_9PEZI|nr:hypothetical protein B0T19DRAFT_451958 [Cercophora scortea]
MNRNTANKFQNTLTHHDNNKFMHIRKARWNNEMELVPVERESLHGIIVTIAISVNKDVDPPGAVAIWWGFDNTHNEGRIFPRTGIERRNGYMPTGIVRLLAGLEGMLAEGHIPGWKEWKDAGHSMRGGGEPDGSSGKGIKCDCYPCRVVIRLRERDRRFNEYINKLDDYTSSSPTGANLWWPSYRDKLIRRIADEIVQWGHKGVSIVFWTAKMEKDAVDSAAWLIGTSSGKTGQLETRIRTC